MTGSIVHKIPHEGHARKTRGWYLGCAGYASSAQPDQRCADRGVVRHVPDVQHLRDHDKASPSCPCSAGGIGLGKGS